MQNSIAEINMFAGESKSARDSENLYSVKKRFGKIKISDAGASSEDALAPPRPPKPPHMLPENPGHNYLNLDGATESSKPTTPLTPVTALVSDETYDFPRSHQPGSNEGGNTLGKNSRHCYTNAAPSTVDDRVFRYDFPDEEPSSPKSESSAPTPYSNLPSPSMKECSTSVPTTMAPPPPVVYRCEENYNFLFHKMFTRYYYSILSLQIRVISNIDVIAFHTSIIKRFLIHSTFSKCFNFCINTSPTLHFGYMISSIFFSSSFYLRDWDYL